MEHLKDILGDLTLLGRKLTNCQQQLEEYQRYATEACASSTLTIADLNHARDHLNTANDGIWEELDAAGAGLGDVSR
jgi:hypothetical protein